jgi:hypothetical protein
MCLTRNVTSLSHNHRYLYDSRVKYRVDTTYYLILAFDRISFLKTKLMKTCISLNLTRRDKIIYVLLKYQVIIPLLNKMNDYVDFVKILHVNRHHVNCTK